MPPDGNHPHITNEAERIQLERLNEPLCICGRLWKPSLIAAFGFLRQCPTCIFTVSFCVCADVAMGGNIGLI